MKKPFQTTNPPLPAAMNPKTTNLKKRYAKTRGNQNWLPMGEGDPDPDQTNLRKKKKN